MLRSRPLPKYLLGGIGTVNARRQHVRVRTQAEGFVPTQVNPRFAQRQEAGGILNRTVMPSANQACAWVQPRLSVMRLVVCVLKVMRRIVYTADEVHFRAFHPCRLSVLSVLSVLGSRMLMIKRG